jgi:hypothetical protein
MNLTDIIDALLEAKKYIRKKSVANPIKSRAKSYDSINQALTVGNYGDIFTTKAANRLYVITKAKWGKKSKGKVAKGFTPGSATPSADFPSIQKHSARTKLRYNPSSTTKQMAKKFGSRSIKKKYGV